MKNLTDDIPAEKLKRCVDSYISHCVKSVQIRSFFWSLFSCIRTKYGKISPSGPNTEKYGPEISQELQYTECITKYDWKLKKRSWQTQEVWYCIYGSI